MSEIEVSRIVVPDSIDPVIGFKYLQWDNKLLRSTYDSSAWTPHQRFEARCNMPYSIGAYTWELLQRAPSRPHFNEGDFYMPRHTPITAALMLYGGPSDPQRPTQLKAPSRVIPPYGWRWYFVAPPLDHESPQEGCSCGIYMVNSPDEAAGYGHHLNTLLVELAGWGKVIPGEWGYRMQYAYPQAIYTRSTFDDDLVAEIAEMYGVPMVKGGPETDLDITPFARGGIVPSISVLMPVKKKPWWKSLIETLGVVLGASIMVQSIGGFGIYEDWDLWLRSLIGFMGGFLLSINFVKLLGR